MSSFLVFSLVGIASVAILLSSAGFVLFRAQSRALGYWLIGWSTLLAAAFLTLLAPHYPAILPVGPIFTTLSSPRFTSVWTDRSVRFASAATSRSR